MGNRFWRIRTGAGVDVVLNSLTSEGFIEASLSCLKHGGVFLEIGKRNIYTPETMQTTRPDVRYHIIAIDALTQQAPEEIRQLLDTLQQLLSQQVIEPLPLHAFPIEEASSAFSFLQQAKQIGKVIITQPVPLGERLDEQATYLITGGLGALGQVTTQLLLQQGAKHLVLVNRHAPSEQASAHLEQLAEQLSRHHPNPTSGHQRQRPGSSALSSN